MAGLLSDKYNRHFEVLCRLGFKPYDSENEHHHGGNQVPVGEGDILFIEEDFCRQRMFVVLSPSGDWSIFVLENIGMCAYQIVFQWADLCDEFLHYLKMAFSMHGFMKDGDEVFVDD